MKNTSEIQQKKELERALVILGQGSLRRTKPRLSILKALILRHGPFTVEEMHSLKETQNLDRVTLYRSLTALEKIGLVQRCEFGDGISRYEYSRSEHHHHHVVCKECKRIENIEECIPKVLIDTVYALGYQNVSHSLEFFGVCKECAL